MADPAETGLDGILAALRRRADEDFNDPPETRVANRHQVDLAELGLRVSLTRSRYPNRPDGRDEYALTISRKGLDRAPDAAEVATVLTTLFGAAAGSATERGGGPMVRMYRVAAG
jgi:hypothetical protein